MIVSFNEASGLKNWTRLLVIGRFGLPRADRFVTGFRLVRKAERIYKLFKILSLCLQYRRCSGHFNKPGSIGGPKHRTNNAVRLLFSFWRLYVYENYRNTVDGYPV